MTKILAGLVIGLSVGLAIGVTVTQRPGPDSAETPDPEAVAAQSAVPSDVSDQNAGLRRQIQATEARLREAQAALEAFRQESASRVNARPLTDDVQAQIDELSGARGVRPRFSNDPGEVVERLIAGGFSPHRADWIRQRLDELMLERIAQRNESLRENPDGIVLEGFSPIPDLQLRDELGDFEYQQYLLALGREPYASILDVIGGSPAAEAGLRAGDQIVYYDGTRVFDFLEVTPLTMAGNPGETVVIDILRDGEPIQLVVPRGPLGVRLGSDRTLALEGIPLP